MKCKTCNDTGYAKHVKSSMLGVNIFTNCHCEIGTKNSFVGPTIDGARALPFPTKLFVPSPTMSGIEILKAWAETLEISRKYWESQNQPVQDSFDSLLDT
jgi:hypothetical protein